MEHVDGHRIWRSPRAIALLDQTPTVGYGRVFAGGARPDDRNLYAFDEATGRLQSVRRAGAGCLSGTPPFLCGYRVMSGSSLVGGNLWFVRFLWCGACADTDGSASIRALPVTRWAKPPASETLVRGWDEISQYWDPATPPPVIGDRRAFVPTLSAGEAAYRLVAAASEWDRRRARHDERHARPRPRLLRHLRLRRVDRHRRGAVVERQRLVAGRAGRGGWSRLLAAGRHASHLPVGGIGGQAAVAVLSAARACGAFRSAAGGRATIRCGFRSVCVQ